MKHTKHILAALFICVPFLLIGEVSASGFSDDESDDYRDGSHDWDHLERQQGCERYCINCVANGGNPMCMGIFYMCCDYYGGSPSDSCECRAEM